MIKFMEDFERYVKTEGYPFAVVARKTGIKYNRLRNLRSGAVEPTVVEFIALCSFCKFDYNKYMINADDSGNNQPRAG